MDDGAIQRKFQEALEDFVGRVKEDRSVLAAILCGSLSHDRVWEKSDIDLVLVTIDEKRSERTGFALDVSGGNLHASLMPRAEFRRAVEGTVRNSFLHSLLAKGRLLYAHDPTIADLCDGLQRMGERDAEVQLLRAATRALPSIYKARKWFVTRGDLDYTALWILYAATPLAQMEVIGAGLLVDREVIPQALQLNPDFFQLIYSDLLNTRKTSKAIRKALDGVERYVAEREPGLFGLVLEYLEEIGEARSCTEIEDHFQRNFDVGGVTSACEYLADRGRIGRASIPVRLTRRSNVALQELAFFHLATPLDHDSPSEPDTL